MKKSSTNVISMSQDVELVRWEPSDLHDLSFSPLPNGLSVNSSPNGKAPSTADDPTPPTEQLSPNNMTWTPWEPKDLSAITRRPTGRRFVSAPTILAPGTLLLDRAGGALGVP